MSELESHKAKKSVLLAASLITYLPNCSSKQIGQKRQLLDSLDSCKTIKAEIQSKNSGKKSIVSVKGCNKL